MFAAFDLGDVALDSVDRLTRHGRSRYAVAATDLVDMHQQIGDPALDRCKIAEPCVGGVKPLDQLGDTVFQRAKRGVIGMGELHPFELFDQSGEKLLQLARARRGPLRSKR